MGWRFRKSITILPGLAHLKVSARSVGVTVGVPGLHVSLNSRGQFTRSFGIPGTGLFNRRTWTLGERRSRAGKGAGGARVMARLRLLLCNVVSRVGLPSHRAFAAGILAIRHGDPDAGKHFEEVLHHRKHYAPSAAFFLAWRDASGGVEDRRRAIERLREIRTSGRRLPDVLLRLYHPRAEISVDLTPALQVIVPVSKIAAALLLGELLQQEGDGATAITVLEDACERFPSDLRLRVSLLDLYCTVGRFDDAIAASQGMSSTDDLSCQVMIFRARAFAGRAEWEPCHSALRDAMASKKRDHRLRCAAFYERALMNIALGDHKAAHKDFAAAYALDTEYLDVKERYKAPADPPPDGAVPDDGDPAEILRRARRRARLNQRELARRAGVTFATVSNTETGRSKPKHGTMKRLLETCAHAAREDEETCRRQDGDGTDQGGQES